MFNKHPSNKLLGLSAVGLFALAASPNALALTASGTNISNTATINYNVASTAQTAIVSNTETFMVDAKVDLTVAGTGGNINVTPGTTAQVLKFTVTNTGNEPFDYALTTVAGTLNFTPTNVAIYVDDGDGLRNAGDTLTSTITNLAAAASKVVFIQADIPLSATNTQIATYSLKAVAALASAGGAIPAQAADVKTTKQYVYADGAGTATGDVVRDKTHSTNLTYTAVTSALTISKTSVVIWDPVNLTVSPLYIPGAVVEYAITISNGAGGAQADAIALTDTLAANLTIPPTSNNFAAGKSMQVTAPNLYAGAATALTDASDADQGTVAGQLVTVSGVVLTAGQSATVKIRAEIQ